VRLLRVSRLPALRRLDLRRGGHVVTSAHIV
jgi:hypothetical protein